MDNNYTVVVLLSSYNGQEYIEEQIKSIMSQKNIANLSLIVRDDGSNDNTVVILEALKKKYVNLEILEGENLGFVGSFIELLKYSVKKKFDYYAFSDQDDIWLSDKLNAAITALQKENNSMPLLYGSCSMTVNNNLEYQGIETQKKLREITFFNSAIQNFCPGHNQVLNRKLAELVINKTKSIQNIYFQDMWITNIATTAGRVVFDNTSHTLYRMHTNNQLGYGNTVITWIKDHIVRVRKQESKKVSIQLKFFTENFEDELSVEEKEEIRRFFASQKTLLCRLKYVCHTKMYRQRKREDILFKILYLLGGYDVSC